MSQRFGSRTDAIEFVATTFMNRSSRLMRLQLRFGARELTRTEAGLLLTLIDGPRRITELAETEALAQPTVTKMVDKLQRRGLVERKRAEDDGRVVLVTVSPTGQRIVESYRAQSQAVMRETVEELSDEELGQLVAASEILDRLIETLQNRAEDS